MLNEKEFHKSRIAFMIINQEVIFLENSPMSHIEWYTSLGLPIEKFDNIVRGYTKDNKIIYYKGDFLYDEEVLDVAKNTSYKIMEYIGNFNLKVFAGVTKGEIGAEWDPTIEISSVNLKKK